MTDAKLSLMTYTMLTDDEEQKLSTLEGEVLGFVLKVLGSTQQPIWTGGTAAESRMIRLVVPGQTPPAIIELLPSDVPKLTPRSLIALLNAQVSRQWRVI